MQDKNKELSALKGSIKLLQDSHVKFRSQIQALESVKELTVTLQTQVSVFQQENIQLVAENKELLDMNVRSEQKLGAATKEIDDLRRRLHDMEVRSENMKGRYDEASESQAAMEKLAIEEQAKRQAAENRLQSTLTTVEQLRRENIDVQEKLQASTARISDTNKELGQAAKQLSIYST